MTLANYNICIYLGNRHKHSNILTNIPSCTCMKERYYWAGAGPTLVYGLSKKEKIKQQKFCVSPRRRPLCCGLHVNTAVPVFNSRSRSVSVSVPTSALSRFTASSSCCFFFWRACSHHPGIYSLLPRSSPGAQLSESLIILSASSLRSTDSLTCWWAIYHCIMGSGLFWVNTHLIGFLHACQMTYASNLVCTQGPTLLFFFFLGKMPRWQLPLLFCSSCDVTSGSCEW